ncbi:MAG TPA: hypothetical protein PLM71_04705 [Syntrophorhabdaceae bacterium]|nr:hypothetical protein [Syntrophorhabdaceae bacterium]
MKNRRSDHMDFYVSHETQSYILRNAYIPEHIIGLMKAISGGDLGMIGDFIFYVKDNWLIFIGYPICGITNKKDLSLTTDYIDKLINAYDPDYLWAIAPEIPGELKKTADEFQSDYYYTLATSEFNPARRLLREVEKANKTLMVTANREFTTKHKALRDEFIKSRSLHPLVESLYKSMEKHLEKSDTAFVLNATTSDGKLCAFYCLDSGADNFLAYIMGCHSKVCYVPHASDLLFVEMVRIAKEMGKSIINLGLGVNEGLKRFKMKWGGRPTIPYEFIELKRRVLYHNLLKKLESIL